MPAGETVKFTATVTNRGTATAWRVRALSKCDDYLFEDREFVFGRVGAGETRSWTVPVKIDRAALTRLDRIRLEVYDEKDAKLCEARSAVTIAGQKRPRFAYGYQLMDDIKGNHDGRVQPGESFRLHVVVKNVGEGKSFETLATLSNKSGDGVSVNKGRFNVDHLAPGDAKAVDFTFDVAPDFKGDAVALQMDVYDQVLHEYVTDKLTFPVARVVAGSASKPALAVAPSGPQSALSLQVVPPSITVDNSPLAVDSRASTSWRGRATTARWPTSSSSSRTAMPRSSTAKSFTARIGRAPTPSRFASRPRFPSGRVPTR